MSKHTDNMNDTGQTGREESRRAFLKKAGKFAVYTPPTVMMLMKPSYGHMSKSVDGRPYCHRGNNGIGNGYDRQPPGNPKPNDTRGVHKGHRPDTGERTRWFQARHGGGRHHDDD